MNYPSIEGAILSPDSLVEVRAEFHRSHVLRGNASRMPGQEFFVVDALRPVPQERHNCIPTLERGNDSKRGNDSNERLK